MRSALVLAVVAFSTLASMACRSRELDGDRHDDEDDNAAVIYDGGPAPPKARCEAVAGWKVELAPRGTGGADVLVGDTAHDGARLLVGIVRRVDGGSVASVADIDLDKRRSSLVDLGASHVDAPAPRPFFANKTAWIAMHERAPIGRHGAHRVAVFRLGKEPKRVATLPEGRGDSFGLDAAGIGERAVVVWDDDAPWGSAIKAVSIGKDDEVGEPVPVSPEGTDARGPRIVAGAAGAWVAWTAERSRVTPDSGSGGGGEGQFDSWIQLRRVGQSGRPTSSATDITPPHGAAGGFDLAGFSGGFHLVAEATTAGQDRIVYTTWSRAAPSPARTLASEGVGRGSPAVVSTGKDPWTLYASENDESVMGPIVDVGRHAIEPALAHGRPLGLWPPGDKQKDNKFQLLILYVAPGRAELGAVRCQR